MAAAPRKQKFTNVPNLYVKRDKRTGKLACQYKDIRTKKFHGLGSDLAIAVSQATKLNAIIAQQIIDQETQAILERNASHGITVNAWYQRYTDILAERLEHNEIKKSTFDQKRWAMSAVLKSHGKIILADLNTMAISKILNAYAKAGKATMAQRVRTVLIELFDEAIAAGHFPADKPNPARVTRAPRIKVKRARLTIDFFKEVLAWAKENQKPYLWHSYLLAVSTAQRLDDIGKAQFTDVRVTDGVKYLGFTQTKTGTKVAIPLDLKLDEIGYTVGDIVTMCRDNVLSPHLFHHSKKIGKAEKGSKVRVKSLSNGFAAAVRAVRPDWGESLPPSFHEMRSLAEREYKKQGINTQKLLGHKHQTTTDTYADARGHDWIIVTTGTGQ